MELPNYFSTYHIEIKISLVMFSLIIEKWSEIKLLMHGFVYSTAQR